MKGYALLLVLLFAACKEKQIAKNEVSQIIQDSCFKKFEKINIAKKILKIKNVQTYLHLDLKERNPVRIIKK